MSEAGTNVLMKISNDGGATYTAVAGQADTQMSGSGNPIDVSNKTTGGWGATIQGTRSVTITLSGQAQWPDTDGLDAMRQAWEDQSEIDGQFVMNSAGSNYTGKFSITQFDVGGSHDGSTEYNITLQNAGALTYSAA